jgi:DNA-binding FrmR family transcriptional regulator
MMQRMAETRGYSMDRDDYLRRLRRIEGQVRGLQRMVSEDQYCIDVLTQISSVTSALNSVALGLLDQHLRHCVKQAVSDHDTDADAKLAEAMAAVARLVKS